MSRCSFLRFLLDCKKDLTFGLKLYRLLALQNGTFCFFRIGLAVSRVFSILLCIGIAPFLFWKSQYFGFLLFGWCFLLIFFLFLVSFTLRILANNNSMLFFLIV